MLPNVSVAPKRNKLQHYILLAATGCTHLLALYWLILFIHETHVIPSSGKVETKRHLLSYFVISGSECCPMWQLLQTGTRKPHYVHLADTCCTHLVALYYETHVMPSIQTGTKKPHYVHLASTGCTHLVALYWLMVFIHETHVMPSSGKV